MSSADKREIVFLDSLAVRSLRELAYELETSLLGGTDVQLATGRQTECERLLLATCRCRISIRPKVFEVICADLRAPRAGVVLTGWTVPTFPIGNTSKIKVTGFDGAVDGAFGNLIMVDVEVAQPGVLAILQTKGVAGGCVVLNDVTERESRRFW